MHIEVMPVAAEKKGTVLLPKPARRFLLGAAIALLIVSPLATLAGGQLSVFVLSVAALGSLVFTAEFLLVVVVTLGAVGRSSLIGGVLMCAITILGAFADHAAFDFSLRRYSRSLDDVVAAVNQYQHDNGLMPQKLGDLIPGYLATGWRDALSAMDYSAGPDHFSLEVECDRWFSWIRLCYDSDGGRGGEHLRGGWCLVSD